jgi:hypothetical protein
MSAASARARTRLSAKPDSPSPGPLPLIGHDRAWGPSVRTCLMEYRVMDIFLHEVFNTDTNTIVRGATSCQNTDQPREEERLHIRLRHFINPTLRYARLPGKGTSTQKNLLSSRGNTLQIHLHHFVDVEKDQVMSILLSIIPDATFETSSLVDDGRPVTMG